MSYDVKLYRICDHRIFQEEQITEADGKTVVTNFPISNTNVTVKVNGYELAKNNTSEAITIEDVTAKFDGTNQSFVVDSAPIYSGLNLGTLASTPYYIIVQIKVIDEDVSSQMTGIDFSFYTNHNPLLTEINFSNGVNIGDVVVKVNGIAVEVVDLDAITGRIVLAERPLATDVVTVSYFYQATINNFNANSGLVELAETPKLGQQVRVRYYTLKKDGWSLIKKEDSTGMNIVFDREQQTNRGYVIAENVSSQFSGTERSFTVQNTPLMPFKADLRTTYESTLPNSVKVFINGITEPVLGVNAFTGNVEISSAPSSTDIVTTNYWYQKNITPDIITTEYQVELRYCPKCNGLGVLDDLEYDETGKLKTVENEDKLVQDLRKIVITILGSNVSHPWYGTQLEEIIGTTGIPELIETNISAEIQTAVRNMKNLQSQQIVYQTVTDREFINVLNDLSVEQNTYDAGIWQVTAEIISQAGTFTTLEEEIEFDSPFFDLT